MAERLKKNIREGTFTDAALNGVDPSALLWKEPSSLNYSLLHWAGAMGTTSFIQTVLEDKAGKVRLNTMCLVNTNLFSGL